MCGCKTQTLELEKDQLERLKGTKKQRDSGLSGGVLATRIVCSVCPPFGALSSQPFPGNTNISVEATVLPAFVVKIIGGHIQMI